MAQVIIPQRKRSDPLGQVMAIGGGIAGGIYGGGVTGASAGANAGKMGSDLIMGSPRQPAQAVESAISRRITQLDQSPLKQIRDSIDSLKYLPDPAQRAELAMPLLKADYAARMKG